MTTPTKKPVKPSRDVVVVDEVRRQLEDRQNQLMALLGPSIPLERFLTVALHAVNSNPDILTCEPLSIVEAIRESAQLRLEPTGLLGDAYLVKYGTKAKLLPGYRGLMKLARRSGDILAIDAQTVYEGDLFEVDLGTEARIVHRPALVDRGNYRGAYAWARLITNELIVEWMTVADIEVVRKSSSAATSGPWVKAWGEMARKTALRRLMKRLPLATEADRALELEAEAESTTERPGRPSPAIRTVRSHLGIVEPADDNAGHGHLGDGAAGRAGDDEGAMPATVEIEDTGGQTVTMDVVDPDEAASLEVFDGLTEDPEQPGTYLVCGDPSPLTEGAICTLAVGHAGVHRIGIAESWPQH